MDPAAAWGWASPAGRLRADRRARLFTTVGRIAPGDRVLELGCGSGVFTRRVRAPGVRPVALDLSEALLRRARAEVAGAAFLGGDAQVLPFRDGAFDVVYGCSVLHHLDPPRALREVRRVLRPGGRLVFSEPNLLNPQIFLTFNSGPLRPAFDLTADEMAFTRRYVTRVLDEVGFREVSVRYFDFLHPGTPEALVPLLARMTERLERLPVLRAISGSMLIHAER